MFMHNRKDNISVGKKSWGVAKVLSRTQALSAAYKASQQG